jgi:hypothetical protein
MPSKRKSTRGGARPGAGRKPTTGRGSEGRTVVAASFSPDEILEIDAARGETPAATWVREVALAAARKR